MLLRCDITQHACAVISRGCCTDATRNVVVSRKNISDKRTKHIKRCAVTKSALQFHVVFNLIERNMTWSFDHHLNTFSPSSFSQFANRFQLCQLCAVGCIGQTTGTQTIANRKCHVVFTHHIADSFPSRVHQILTVVHQHPLRKQTSTATDNSNQTLANQRQMFLQNSCVNREIINTLLRLMRERLHHDRFIKFLEFFPNDH